jgi:hypothetical protein
VHKTVYVTAKITMIYYVDSTAGLNIYHFMVDIQERTTYQAVENQLASARVVRLTICPRFVPCGSPSADACYHLDIPLRLGAGPRGWWRRPTGSWLAAAGRAPSPCSAPGIRKVRLCEAGCAQRLASTTKDAASWRTCIDYWLRCLASCSPLHFSD